MCVLYIEYLPPSTFRFVFTFFLACSLASLLTTSPTWSRQLRHIWHIGHAGNTRSAARASILACQLRPFALARTHLANHCAHFAKLLKELVKFLNGGTTTTSNTLAPTAVDDIWVAAFFKSHREDHRFNIFELITFQGLFHFGRSCQFVEAGNHLHHLPQWSHTFQLTHGVEKIFQIELALLEFGLGLECLFLVDGFLRPLNEGENVAHAQDTRGEAVWIERLQSIGFFADAHKFDRYACNGTNGEGGTAPGVTIHFGQDHAGERDGFVKVVGYAHCFLTCHGISHQQYLAWLDTLANTD